MSSPYPSLIAVTLSMVLALTSRLQASTSDDFKLQAPAAATVTLGHCDAACKEIISGCAPRRGPEATGPRMMMIAQAITVSGSSYPRDASVTVVVVW